MDKKRILIVDDEKDFIDPLSERLEAKGFDIIKAYTGKEGLEKAYVEKPDLIILDIMMPEMDGYDVCRKLKIDENYKKIPIIMLTAKFQPNDVEFAKEMGANAYLTKPLEMDVLLNMVNGFLKIKQGKRYKGDSH